VATPAKDKTEGQLKELARTEMAAAKDRLAARTAAARDYAKAAARLTDAASTWQRIQTEATAAQARSVAALIDSDMKPAEVARLLGIDTKQLRSLRTASPAPPNRKQPKTTAAAASNETPAARTQRAGDTHETGAPESTQSA